MKSVFKQIDFGIYDINGTNILNIVQQMPLVPNTKHFLII
jgi:hypothetical protein